MKLHHYCQNAEHLAVGIHLYYLSREFLLIIVIVYIPPEANVEVVCDTVMLYAMSGL